MDGAGLALLGHELDVLKQGNTIELGEFTIKLFPFFCFVYVYI